MDRASSPLVVYDNPDDEDVVRKPPRRLSRLAARDEGKANMALTVQDKKSESEDEPAPIVSDPEVRAHRILTRPFADHIIDAVATQGRLQEDRVAVDVWYLSRSASLRAIYSQVWPYLLLRMLDGVVQQQQTQ